MFRSACSGATIARSIRRRSRRGRWIPTFARVTVNPAAGVTRVSLGVQALDDTVLKTLGRRHDARGARAAFDAAREAGYDDVSVDVMYGLPGLAVDAWVSDVERVLAWDPDHVSAYAL